MIERDLPALPRCVILHLWQGNEITCPWISFLNVSMVFDGIFRRGMQRTARIRIPGSGYEPDHVFPRVHAARTRPLLFNAFCIVSRQRAVCPAPASSSAESPSASPGNASSASPSHRGNRPGRVFVPLGSCRIFSGRFLPLHDLSLYRICHVPGRTLSATPAGPHPPTGRSCFINVWHLQHSLLIGAYSTHMR